MADKLYYNQNEIIFISLFAGFLIISMFFMFFYPDETTLNLHTKQILQNLKPKELQDMKPKKRDKVKPPPVKRTQETVL